jgi:hypothetical protein
MTFSRPAGGRRAGGQVIRRVGPSDYHVRAASKRTAAILD